MRKSYVLFLMPLLVLVSVSCNLKNSSPDIYTLSTNVTPAESGVVNPGDGEYESESELEIYAEPAEGFIFDKWEGDFSGTTNPANLTFDTDKELTAIFIRKEYPLNITIEGEGRVKEEILKRKTDYEYETTVQLYAMAEPGWNFVGWENAITGNSNPEVLEVKSETNVTAVFEITEYSVNINVEGEGSVISDPQKDIYTYGETISFTAEPTTGWRFLEWRGDVSGTESTITINEISSDHNITAVFVPVSDPLWGMGYNHNGQLGDGTNTEQYNPVRNIYDVAEIAAGAFHSLYIKNDGTLWAMGFNEYGQLGNGTTQDLHRPRQIETDVIKVTAGEHHSLFIKEDGTLWAMGQNEDGQLGTRTTYNRSIPVQIDTDVIDVTAGAWHTLYVKSDGTLWAMGRNNFGQLGNNTTVNQQQPVQIATDVKTVAAGKRHSLFITNDGTLYGMGRNAEGQLGLGEEEGSGLPLPDQISPVQIATNVEVITGGTDHSMYIKTDRTLWAMGNNEDGQLGDGTTVNRNSPIQIANNATHIAAGNRHSLYIDSNNVLWGMGLNANGQLGDGTTQNRSEPIQIDDSIIDVAAGINHSLYLEE